MDAKVLKREVHVWDALGNCCFNMVVEMTASQADLHGQKLCQWFQGRNYDVECIEASEAYIETVQD